MWAGAGFREHRRTLASQQNTRPSERVARGRTRCAQLAAAREWSAQVLAASRAPLLGCHGVDTERRRQTRSCSQNVSNTWWRGSEPTNRTPGCDDTPTRF